MDKQIRNEIKQLMKQGFPEQLAIITACANNGRPELATEHIEEIEDEQSEIVEMMKKIGMIPLHVAYNIPLQVMDASGSDPAK